MVRKNWKNYNKYMKGYMKGVYYRRKQEVFEKLGGKCVSCGACDDLQLDHIDPKTKLYNISHIYSMSEKIFWAEVAKCQLLCSKCHKEKTIRDFDRKPDPEHGTHQCYIRKKCRCDLCKKANRDYMKAYRAKEKERYEDSNLIVDEPIEKIS
jgi:5-methylcytosine-specific restriction endonuclease McrA